MMEQDEWHMLWECGLMRDSKLARRQMLRMCTMMGIGMLTTACTTSPPQAPVLAPTWPPELVTQIPTLTPYETAQPTPVRQQATPTPPPRLPSAPAAGPLQLSDIGDFAELVKLAQAEAELSVIGLSREWLNYGEIIESYKNTYGIRVIELAPDASSSEQLATIRQTAGQTGIQVPDVVDVSLDVATSPVAQGLFQAYQSQFWGDVPEALKDPTGLWCATYYGVMTFAVNADVVKSPPKTWSELRNSTYKSQFALPADPRQSATAQYAVIAAALANDGAPDDVSAGLQFFAELNQQGIINNQVGSRSRLLIGETPIVPMWSYIAYAIQASSANNPQITVVVPEPVVGAAYVHAINAYAMHPYAARLWMEHVLATSTQQMYAKASATPVRITNLRATQALSSELMARLPAVNKMNKTLFLSGAQLTQARNLIATQWDSVVQLTIQQ